MAIVGTTNDFLVRDDVSPWSSRGGVATGTVLVTYPVPLSPKAACVGIVKPQLDAGSRSDLEVRLAFRGVIEDSGVNYAIDCTINALV